ncbi:DUF418 domain-containing protein [Natronobacterium gregoryi]|uniref:DUF418 domain-containing protein n=2 Tax=Natronobacterium gregoryi TaxID=44930 RepID=L0AEM3_NATGS|nr:DUF418 domain-containing protein [Natronobacterium gregoryi]AFZ72358.1 putative membrane protein [Natronobacterium gregoryi SP2]ELY64257.1 hypothetical protein C490_14750 [Natronobacterium gregoryi SP2]PLK20327.1 DUF418 domain-containing protein [Natronobacterium gregoryi SP2]SFJ22429.1 uncharacterized protein SAMN05443661_11839 [Natronobacterium gregoryi]
MTSEQSPGEDTASTTADRGRAGACNGDESGPTDPDDRILGLDVLRGFALLGILVINVWLFAMPMVASYNPTLYGDFSGGSYVAWFVSHVFFEQKFVTLFTFLFGAGMVLFLESKERKGQPARRLHFRRVFWLLVIGLGHAYLLWYGDILVAYALCGFVLVFVRNWRPKWLLALGLVMFALPALFYLLSGVGYVVADAGTQAEIEQAMLTGTGADPDAVDEEIATYRGGWLEQMDHRIATAAMMHTVGFVFESFWTLGGLMIVGMALYKWGVLSNERSTRFYRRLLVGGATVGLALILTGVWYRELVDWNTAHVLLFAHQFNYWGSLLVALAYVSGAMLLCRAAAGGLVTTALSAVGRTAFSNYLLQTVLATSIFYGHGIGLFGQLSRAELLGVVVLIWTIQVPLSVAWLNRYRFGPVEWVWRTLTYGDRQPMRLEKD